MEQFTPAPQSGNRLISYVKESQAELKKVTWPTKRETLVYTTLVIAISVAVAAFLALADYLLTIGLEQILK